MASIRRFGMYSSLVLAVLCPTVISGQASPSVEAAVARSIEDRMPVDTASTFPADVGQVWLWSSIHGAAGQTVTHVWRHEEHEWTVELDVGADRWRTWSSKVIPPEWTGAWTVEIRDETGNVLETVRFTVGA